MVLREGAVLLQPRRDGGYRTVLGGAMETGENWKTRPELVKGSAKRRAGYVSWLYVLVLSCAPRLTR